MKTYRPPRKLLAEIDSLLNAKPSIQHSPLEEVIELLCQGRHYTWMGIYLAAGKSNPLLSAGRDTHPAVMTSPETKSRMLVSMKIAGKELGVLAVQNPRENISSADRVLLEEVAVRLARSLTGRGKYLARRARESAAKVEKAESKPRAPQAVSASGVRSAAVGEK